MNTSSARVLVLMALASTLAACGGGSGGDAASVPVNSAPVASAGVTQNVMTGTVVTLNGSASTDLNSDPLTYAWTLTSKPAGSSAVLSTATSAAPTFTADLAGTYAVSLVVNDGKVNSAVASMTVTVTTDNAAPVADAGGAQSVTTGTLVSLSGLASTDANSDPLSYAWTLTAKPTGSMAVLSAATSATPTFAADLAGAYVSSLIVNDGKASSMAATVTVTAVIANAAPVANAGTAQRVSTSQPVTLDGRASTDANNDPLTYAWALTSKPNGSSAALAAATSARPTFTADLVGTYVASLIVSDGKADSSPATVLITSVDSCATSPGNEATFIYDWSLATQKVTFKNNNICDSIFVRATVAPIYTNSPNGVVEVRRSLAPGETLIADAVLPLYLTWKPSVIYSLPNGKTYVYQPAQAGQTVEFSFELLLLASTETYEGTLPQFTEMFAIGQTEDRYGDCANFSWTDRRNGKYRILPNASAISGQCYVGNIDGIKVDGSSIYLPPLRYFVTAP